MFRTYCRNIQKTLDMFDHYLRFGKSLAVSLECRSDGNVASLLAVETGAPAGIVQTKRTLRMVWKDLAGRFNQARIDQLTRQVVAQAQPPVQRLCGGRIERMTSHEARGYVRARAARPVREVAGALFDGEIAKSVQRQISLRALDSVVQAVTTKRVDAPVKVIMPRYAA